MIDGLYELGGCTEANLQSARGYRTVVESIEERCELNGKPLKMQDGG